MKTDTMGFISWMLRAPSLDVALCLMNPTDYQARRKAVGDCWHRARRLSPAPRAARRSSCAISVCRPRRRRRQRARWDLPRVPEGRRDAHRVAGVPRGGQLSRRQLPAWRSWRSAPRAPAGRPAGSRQAERPTKAVALSLGAPRQARALPHMRRLGRAFTRAPRPLTNAGVACGRIANRKIPRNSSWSRIWRPLHPADPEGLAARESSPLLGADPRSPAHNMQMMLPSWGRSAVRRGQSTRQFRRDMWHGRESSPPPKLLQRYCLTVLRALRLKSNRLRSTTAVGARSLECSCSERRIELRCRQPSPEVSPTIHGGRNDDSLSNCGRQHGS